jgi:hypothetical protein
MARPVDQKPRVERLHGHHDVCHLNTRWNSIAPIDQPMPALAGQHSRYQYFIQHILRLRADSALDRKRSAFSLCGRLPGLAALPAGLCLTIASTQARGAERRGTNPLAGFILARAIGDTCIGGRIRKSGHFLEAGLGNCRAEKRCDQGDVQRQFHERTPKYQSSSNRAAHTAVKAATQKPD